MYFTELNLSESLQEAVKKMGFEETTPIQAEAIPPGLAGRDIIGCAQTGTGKTAAFLLPAFQRLLQDERKTKHPRVVVLAPTRELVIQVARDAQALAGRTPIRTAAIYGGAKMGPQINKLRRGVDVVIATPGRLQDHMRRKNINFKALQVLVLDEADRMLDMGFLPDIKKSSGKCPNNARQCYFQQRCRPLS